MQPRVPEAGGGVGGDVVARAQGVPSVRDRLQQSAARRPRQSASQAYRSAQGNIHTRSYTDAYKGTSNSS